MGARWTFQEPPLLLKGHSSRGSCSKIAPPLLWSHLNQGEIYMYILLPELVHVYLVFFSLAAIYCELVNGYLLPRPRGSLYYESWHPVVTWATFLLPGTSHPFFPNTWISPTSFSYPRFQNGLLGGGERTF